MSMLSIISWLPASNINSTPRGQSQERWRGVWPTRFRSVRQCGWLVSICLTSFSDRLRTAMLSGPHWKTIHIRKWKNWNKWAYPQPSLWAVKNRTCSSDLSTLGSLSLPFLSFELDLSCNQNHSQSRPRRCWSLLIENFYSKICCTWSLSTKIKVI